MVSLTNHIATRVVLHRMIGPFKIQVISNSFPSDHTQNTMFETSVEVQLRRASSSPRDVSHVNSLLCW